MKKIFILLLISILCLFLASCNVSSQNSAQESKSLYELAVEAGFEGTLEEWSLAVANVKDTSEKEIECTCQNKIAMADAIIIAQTHYFGTVNAKTDFGYYYLFETIEEPNVFVENIENEYWYIMPVLYQNGEPALIDGGCQYVYVIKKSTGEISNLLIFTGE